MSGQQDLRNRRRERLRYQLRTKSVGRPRLSVFRSGKHIYAQIIDDKTARTLAAASSLDAKLREQMRAELTQLHPLRVLFSVPQTEAGDLSIGERFSLKVASLPSDPGSFTGEIRALSPQLDTATNARAVEGVITGDSSALLPGMYGVVTLQTGAPVAAFSLPATALNDDTLGRYVYALSAGPDKSFIAHAVYVTEYAQTGSTAVIGASGLSAGEQVVAIGGFKLDDGDSVTLQGQ